MTKSAMILALDIGTSSTRAAIYNAQGRRLVSTTTQFSYPLITDQEDRAEIRPADLKRAVDLTINGTLAAWRGLKQPAAIAGIGVSCFWHSLMGIDEKGRPLTPIYTWADSRCHKEAASLRRKGGEKALHEATGCMARTSFWPAKLLWLRRTQPDLFQSVSRWVSAAEWIQLGWCGNANVSISMASGTGLLDGRTLRWRPSLLRPCQVKAHCLNSISDLHTCVSPHKARRFPELATVPWYPAIGDGAAGNLGSGAVTPNIAAINLGTSAALRVMIKRTPARHEPLAPFGLFSYRLNSTYRLVGGAVSNAGNLHAWALRELNLPTDPVKLETLLRGRNRPVESLTILPFWMAERAPTWPENLPSVVVGMTQATKALDLLQALHEATYHRLAQIAEKVEALTHRKLSFIVSGGIQHSSDALQRLANVLGRPVHASNEPEASLRGAACFALEQLGFHPKPLRLGRLFQPNVHASQAYLKSRQAQIRLENFFEQLSLDKR